MKTKDEIEKRSHPLFIETYFKGMNHAIDSNWRTRTRILPLREWRSLERNLPKRVAARRHESPPTRPTTLSAKRSGGSAHHI